MSGNMNSDTIRLLRLARAGPRSCGRPVSGAPPHFVSAGPTDEERDAAAALAEALDRLPAAYRDVLVLCHLEGLSFPAVARRMGRPLRSVEKLWIRALARLRRTVGDYA
jgi:DNA-directed RNA polymerase specialized sigma24 family protein